MTPDRASLETVSSITIKESDQSFGLEWRARIDFVDGSSREVKESSLRKLLVQLPHFERQLNSDVIRVTVMKGANFYRSEEVLDLLQLNEGAKGIDLSGCVLHNVDLSRGRIQELQRHFSQRYGFDPVWHERSLTGGVDLAGILAQEAEFVGANLEGANLSSAQLDRSIFSSAILSGSYFRNAKLNHCWFEDADLQGAHLSVLN